MFPDTGTLDFISTADALQSLFIVTNLVILFLPWITLIYSLEFSILSSSYNTKL